MNEDTEEFMSGFADIVESAISCESEIDGNTASFSWDGGSMECQYDQVSQIMEVEVSNPDGETVNDGSFKYGKYTAPEVAKNAIVRAVTGRSL